MLSVRPAVAADVTEVAGVHVRSWQVAYRGLVPDEYLDGLKLEDRAARYTFGGVEFGRPVTILALEEAVIWGFATIGPARGGSAQRVGELLALYVDPGRWGRGIGRLLIAEARNRLSEAGFVEAILWVLAGNGRAERFYHADGWTLDGARRKETVWGVAVDEVRYRRALMSRGTGTD